MLNLIAFLPKGNSTRVCYTRTPVSGNISMWNGDLGVCYIDNCQIIYCGYYFLWKTVEYGNLYFLDRALIGILGTKEFRRLTLFGEFDLLKRLFEFWTEPTAQIEQKTAELVMSKGWDNCRFTAVLVNPEDVENVENVENPEDVENVEDVEKAPRLSKLVAVFDEVNIYY